MIDLQASVQDTYDILTDRGPAAIAVMRVVSRDPRPFVEAHIRFTSKRTLRGLKTGDVARAVLLDDAGEAVDDILVSMHESGPVWDLRLHLHGSPWIVEKCRELLEQSGFTAAGGGGLPLWKTNNGIQSEAYALLPGMMTIAGARWLMRQAKGLTTTLTAIVNAPLDDNGLRESRTVCRELAARREVFDWFATPLRVALVGPPNAGKSTLANALAEHPISIVSPTPGTTRDWLEIPAEAGGFPVVWLDTAGLRPAADALEAESVARTRTVMGDAGAIVFVLDGTREGRPMCEAFAREYADTFPACVAVNKCDQSDTTPQAASQASAAWSVPVVSISARDRIALDKLVRTLLEALGRGAAATDPPGAFTKRQADILVAAADTEKADEFRAAIRRCLRASQGDAA